MPNIDIVNGVKMNVYANDHVPPHIHALYGEHEALIDIQIIHTIKGFLPKKQLTIALGFVQQNQQALLSIFYQLNPTTQKL